MTQRASSSESSPTRRALLQGGLCASATLVAGRLPGFAGASRAPTLRAPKRMLVIYLEGGNDGLNTVIPTKLSAYYDRRPNLAIPSDKSLSLDVGPVATQDYRLHPALKNLQQLWSKGDVAVIQKVGYPDPNLSHFLSLDVWGRGTRKAASSGWLARLQDAHAVDRFSVVGLGLRGQLDFRGSRTPPLLVESLDRFRAADDPLYRDHSRHRKDVVAEVMRAYGGMGMRSQSADATQLGFETVELLQAAARDYRSKAVYASSGISRRLREAAMLMQRGHSLRAIYCKDGGYDTHAGQGAAQGRHADLLGRLDVALGAFHEDLVDMGLWKDTAIAVVSEFGRRNFENGSKGTGHGTANCAFVIGGSVKGGLHGPDITASDLALKFPEYQIDFRSVYRALIQDHLGLDARPVLPEAEQKRTELKLFSS